jgi:hypothetical protein
MAVNGSAWAMLSRKNTAYNHSRVRFSVSAFSARDEPTELPRLRPSRPEAASTAPDEVAVAPASSAGIHRGGGGRDGTAAPAPRGGSAAIILEVLVGRGRRKCTTHRDARRLRLWEGEAAVRAQKDFGADEAHAGRGRAVGLSIVWSQSAICRKSLSELPM